MTTPRHRPESEPLLTPSESRDAVPRRPEDSVTRWAKAGRSSPRSAHWAVTAVTASPRFAHCSRATRTPPSKPEFRRWAVHSVSALHRRHANRRRTANPRKMRGARCGACVFAPIIFRRAETRCLWCGHGHSSRARSRALSYSSGTADTPLLGETIDANLRRIVAAFGARAAVVDIATGRRLDLRRTRRGDVDELARGLLRARRRARPAGGHLGAELHPEWFVVQYATARVRRDPGQHQPGLPHPRTGVRAGPGRHHHADLGAWRSPRTSEYRGHGRTGPSRAPPPARPCAR